MDFAPVLKYGIPWGNSDRAQHSLGTHSERLSALILLRVRATCAAIYRLFPFHGDQAEGDCAPEQARAHLHREMLRIVGVPDPDIAAIFHHAGIGCGLYTDGLVGSSLRLQLFATLHLHGHQHGPQWIGYGQIEVPADFHGLRGSVKDPGQQVRQAIRNARFQALFLAGHQVALVQNGLSVLVVQAQRGADLASAFDRLLVELRGAPALAIKAGLEAVRDMEQKVDGSGCIGGGGQPLPVAIGVKVKYGNSGRKDAPIHGVRQGLVLRKCKSSPRCGQGWHRLTGRICLCLQGADKEQSQQRGYISQTDLQSKLLGGISGITAGNRCSCTRGMERGLPETAALILVDAP